MKVEEAYMRAAIRLAEEARLSGDIPVGAVVVKNGEIVGRGGNTRELCGRVSGHAEIVALDDAAQALGTWKLNDCTLYVTLEPCPMCAGAIISSRIDKVVFGAPDKGSGALGGAFDMRTSLKGSPMPEVCGGVLEKECRALLDAFFDERRRQSAAGPKRLPREFFLTDADLLAPMLLGKVICRRMPDGSILRSRITETECYKGTSDTACHASKGKTDRNRVMWSRGGTVYVYLCYGMHNMLNIVSGQKGDPQAVLVRGTEDACGPGRLTSYLSIDRKLNGSDVIFSDELWLEYDGYEVERYTSAPRVGIAYASVEDRERCWRFILEK